MRTLNYNKVWLTLGCAFIVGVWYLSLTPHPPQLDISNIDKFEHALAYSALTGWFIQLFRRSYHLRIAAGFIGMGIMIEFVQGLTGYRAFDYFDILANTTGAVLAWLAGGTLLANILERIDRRLGGTEGYTQ